MIENLWTALLKFTKLSLRYKQRPNLMIALCIIVSVYFTQEQTDEIMT